MRYLSVAIPSYRRADSVRVALGSIFASVPDHFLPEVIVINDSGRECDIDAYRRVVEESDCPEKIRLIENPRNLGYPRALSKIFEECRSDYVIIGADDDIFKLHNLEVLVDFLRDKAPDICSTQFLRNGKVHRGETKTRKADLTEFSKLNGHAPGVVYRVAAVQPIIRKLIKLLYEKNTFAEVYPQVVFSIDLMLRNGNCWFFSEPFIEEGAQLSSGIKDSSGEAYWSLGSRIQQLADLDKFIMMYEESSLRNEIIAVARKNGFKKCFRAEKELFEEMLAYQHEPILLQVKRKLRNWARTNVA